MRVCNNILILFLAFLLFSSCQKTPDLKDALSGIANNDISKIERFLDTGGSIEADVGSLAEKSKKTLLHHAAIYGDRDVVNFLLAKGANPNATDYNGQTPIMTIFTTREKESDRFELVALLARVTDLNKEDVRGRSVLDLAKQYGPPYDSEIIDILTNSRGLQEE